MIWKTRAQRIDCSRPLIMGVLNLTPDSFSDGGSYDSPGQAVKRALEMIEEGADLLDLGAESTRPGAGPVSAREETQRLMPVLREIRSLSDIPISVDTVKPEVACVALEAGAGIINDVSGLKDSGTDMARLVAASGAGLVLMHRRGTPATMQSLASYADVTAEVIKELRESIDLALESGIDYEQLAVDPGIGFAKDADHCLRIMAGLERFHVFERPVLVGPSRKSFIGKVTGRETGDREFGTAAAAALAVAKGVQIIRVHNIRAMRDAVLVAHAIQGAGYVRTF